MAVEYYQAYRHVWNCKQGVDKLLSLIVHKMPRDKKNQLLNLTMYYHLKFSEERGVRVYKQSISSPQLMLGSTCPIHSVTHFGVTHYAMHPALNTNTNCTCNFMAKRKGEPRGGVGMKAKKRRLGGGGGIWANIKQKMCYMAVEYYQAHGHPWNCKQGVDKLLSLIVQKMPSEKKNQLLNLTKYYHLKFSEERGVTSTLNSDQDSIWRSIKEQIKIMNPGENLCQKPGIYLCGINASFKQLDPSSATGGYTSLDHTFLINRKLDGQMEILNAGWIWKNKGGEPSIMSNPYLVNNKDVELQKLLLPPTSHGELTSWLKNYKSCFLDPDLITGCTNRPNFDTIRIRPDYTNNVLFSQTLLVIHDST